jgi:hemolysin activation/secretion protein
MGRFSYGLDVMGATTEGDNDISRLGGSGDASKFQFEVKRQQFVAENTMLTLRTEGQYALDPVLSAELFGVGGSEYGRAFDFSTITGDSGYAASVQLGYLIPTNIPELNRLNIFGFVDGGQTYDEVTTQDNEWQGLVSTGIGVEIVAFNKISTKLEVAKPLKMETTTTDYDVQFYGTIGVKFSF